MNHSSLTDYHWLASDDGALSLSTAAELRSAGTSDLRIGEALRTTLSPERAAMVLTQLDLRVRAAAKFSSPDTMLFTRAGLEQATSESIARYRSQRFAGMRNVVDLCCGIGGDAIALSGANSRLTIVDLDPVHLLLAEHNIRAWGEASGLATLLTDVRKVSLPADAGVFIDPARRVASGKRIGYHSEPPLDWSVTLADGDRPVGIKTAPGVPHELVPAGWEMELISLGNDLKEAVLWSPALATSGRRATVVGHGAVTSLAQNPGDEVPVRDAGAGEWLFDPNPAITNAGMVQDLARSIGASRIDTEIGFLVSSRAVHTPLGTTWRILDVLPWHEKTLKQSLRAHDIGPIDIRRRGLAGDVDAITKRLRGPGSMRAMIAMTRMNNRPTAIICLPA